MIWVKIHQEEISEYSETGNEFPNLYISANSLAIGANLPGVDIAKAKNLALNKKGLL